MPDSEQPAWQVLLAGVGGQLQELNAGTRAIADALKLQADAAEGYRKEAKLQTLQSRYALVVVFLVLVATFWIGVGNRHIGQQISSCTSPSGACAQRGQAQQTAAIVTIIRCVLTLPRGASDAQITACVIGAKQ